MDREYYKEYYKKNKSRYINSVRKYQKSDKGIRKIKEYKINNRTKLLEWRRNYEKLRLKEDNTIKIKKLMLSRLRNIIKYYLKTGNIKKLKVSERYNILDIDTLSEYDKVLIGIDGIDYEGIINKLKPFPKDFIKNYQIDHIIPLCRFDFNKVEDIKEAFKPTNLQILTIKQNQSKGTR